MYLDENGLLHVRNSERGTMNKCPQQWEWAWEDGLRPKETPNALWFGTGIHLALADYYRPGRKRSKDFIDVWDNYADEEAMYMRVEIGGLDEEQFIEARELGRTMLINYHKIYGGDKNWNVVATEQSFDVRIPFNEPHPVYGSHFILNGTFDGVYFDEDDKQFKLMEHKTAKSISVRHLPMDNQAGTYWAVAYTVGRDQGWLPKGKTIKEITYNFLRKGVPDDRPKDAQGYATNKPLKAHYIEALDLDPQQAKAPLTQMQEWADKLGVVVLGDRSKNQPPPLYERHAVKKDARQRKQQINRIKDEIDLMILYRDGGLRITKSPSRDTCSFCSFNEMCELHERMSNWDDFRDHVMRATDPYEDHKKSAGVA